MILLTYFILNILITAGYLIVSRKNKSKTPAVTVAFIIVFGLPAWLIMFAVGEWKNFKR